MLVNVVIKQDDNNSWYAYVPALPGCVSVAETRERVMETIKEAVQGFLETEEKDRIGEFSEGEKITVNI
ncbi:MAG: type II toxin-antitoxin system HicB family antitoxin [bacterium]